MSQGLVFDPASAGVVPLASEVLSVNAASIGATYTLPDGYGVHRLTLTASTTLVFPTAVAGKEFTVEYVQGGSGSCTVTLPANVKSPAGTPPTLSTTVGKVDRVKYLCTDGTNFGASAAVLNIS